jgi:hypothetical protein
LAMTNQVTNNGAQMTAFINGPLNMLFAAYGLYQTNVIPILQQMELAWTMHLTNNGAQITAFITGPLTLLAQAYMLYQTNVIPILAAMELAWTNHLLNNGAQITAFITGPLTLLSAQYLLLQTTVPQILATMELAWTNHLSNNGTQISSFISGPINGYINAMPLVAAAVHENLENANQNWTAHAGHVGDMASEITDHLQQLERDVASVMGSIAAAMGIAEQAARDLKSAIDALQSKTITITTNFVTNGTRPAAEGMNEIVRGPTLILAGEEGPEHVKITPYQGAATTSSGIIAAAKGMDAVVGAKMDAKAVSNFAGERGMRLDEFKESEEGKQIDVEVRKVYKSGWIDKDDWKDFAKEYGYRISDFDKKKNGKLADIMFKRMKGVTFREPDLDWDEERGEPSRKTIDWGNTRGNIPNMEGGGAGGEMIVSPQLGMRTGRGGGMGTGGGGGGGSTAFNSRTAIGGEVTVHTDLNVNLIIDRRSMGKIVQEVVTDGAMTTK